MSAPRYFFITGTGRSGTTLLQSMISRGRGVFIPQETHFMSLLWQHRKRLGSLQSDQGWEAAKRAIARRSDVADIPFDLDRFEQLAGEGPRHYATLLGAWLRVAAEAATEPGQPMPTVIGEKSPAHTSFVLELLAMMPGSSVVHIVRDPRDVAVSQREAWNAPAMSVAYRWMLDQKLQEDFQAIVSPERFVTVRYEDLVSDPQAHIRRVCEVLPIEFRPEMLEPHKRKHRGYSDRETHKQRTLQPITEKRIGRYRGKLSPATVAAIERTCRRHMERLGYELEGHAWPIAEVSAAALTVPMVWRKAVSRTPAARIARQARSKAAPPEQPKPAAE